MKVQSEWRKQRKIYLRKQRIWAEYYLPTMSDEDWKKYKKWVREFGRQRVRRGDVTVAETNGGTNERTDKSD